MAKAVGTVDTVSRENLVKFEVGKTYSYMCNNGVSKYASMLKVVKRTKKNIMFIDVDPDFETDEEDVMKYKIEDLEIHDRKFVSMTCNAYLPAPTEAMNLSDGEWYFGTVYASDAVKDVEESKTNAASVEKESTVDTVKRENLVKMPEIEAITAINKNYGTGVYTWYYKKFDTVKKAFRYLWNKRKNYKGTTEFILQIEVDGKMIFNYNSAAKENGLRLMTAEIEKLYNDAEGYSDEEEEEFYYRTNRGTVRKFKIGETNFKAGLAEVSAVESVNVLEDDGSNDDDYDEEEITIDYKFDVEEEDDDDELIDPPEESRVEETETDAEIAAMEKEVERKKRLVEYKTTVTFPQRLKRFSEQLINLYAQIAEIENEMWDYQFYAEELTKEYEGEITALEAEIFNRKMIEAQEYINVSEEAFNISVQAEIDAANNVKAIENLMQAALNTAVTEVEPVSFAIERFNEGEVETAAAVVDTSVTSVEEVPIVDAYAEIEDEIKCKLEAIEGLKAEVEKLREQLNDIKKKDAPVDKDAENFKKLNDEIENCNTQIGIWQGMRVEKELELNKTLREIEHWAYKKMSEVEGKGFIRVRHQTKSRSVVIDKVGDCWDDLEFNAFNDIFKICSFTTYATYTSVEKFKAAIEGLAAAIERGDEEFAFPAEEKA